MSSFHSRFRQIKVYGVSTVAISAAIGIAVPSQHTFAKSLYGANPPVFINKISEAPQTPILDEEEDAKAGNSRKDQHQLSATNEKEIVVTGSHIRGLGASAGSPVISIDRNEIERSGHATTTQIIQSLPQNFSGGASEDTQRGLEGNANRTYSSGVNLRGLGNLATLVLLNGRRLPGANVNGDVPDISLIPASAIERIEILPDGASAVYGSDAVAGVVNFILRKQYEGAESRLRYGTVTDGGMDEYLASQTFGFNWVGGNLLISGEFYHRDHLSADERRFSANSDLRPLGGNDWRPVHGAPGNIINSRTRTIDFAIPPGQDGTNLKPSDLIPGGQHNKINDQQGIDLLPRQQRYSGFGRLSQDIGERIRAFAEIFYSERRFRTTGAVNRTSWIVTKEDPYYVDAYGDGRPIYIAYAFSGEGRRSQSRGKQEGLHGTAGAEYDILADWRLLGHISYAESNGTYESTGIINFDEFISAISNPNRNTALNLIGNGSSNNPDTLGRVFSGFGDQKSKLRAWTGTIMLDGSIFSLPGGRAKAAIGVDGRKERFRWLTRNDNPIIDTNELYKREVISAFAEVFLPVVGDDNRFGGMETFNLSLALRGEEYSDRQLEPTYINKPNTDTLNPKVGLKWGVTKDFSFIASYGKSFRAPSLNQLSNEKLVATTSAPDPQSPTDSSVILLISGTTPNLKNEKATTWTGGVVVHPEALPALRMQFGYYYIKFKNRIVGAESIADMLANSATYQGVVIRNPSTEQLQEACAGATRLDSSPDDCSIPGLVAAIVDARTTNRAVYKTSGVDWSLEYAIQTKKLGDFLLSANTNYIFRLVQSPTSIAPPISILDTFSNPPDFRVRGSINWSPRQAMSINIFANYTDGYTNNLVIPEESIDSHTTFDITMAYQTGNRAKNALLRNISLNLSVLNLFDNNPPFVNTLGGYDPENGDPIGRLVSVTFIKKW